MPQKLLNETKAARQGKGRFPLPCPDGSKKCNRMHEIVTFPLGRRKAKCFGSEEPDSSSQLTSKEYHWKQDASTPADYFELFASALNSLTIGQPDNPAPEFFSADHRHVAVAWW